MQNIKCFNSKTLVRTATSTISIIVFVLIMSLAPTTVFANSSTSQDINAVNPDWRNMNDAERWEWLLSWAEQANPNWRNMNDTERWNWLHNYAYQAPVYFFETTFPVEQWGRPTTSNVAPQHTQNIRRDRHAAFLPPSHGSQTGFFSGEFTTNQANPFAPTFNNNPNASRAVAIEESVFAVLPGETGVNVRADGSHAGGFLASTSTDVAQGSGNSGGNAPHGGPVGDTNPPWINPGNQGNVTITHSPMPNTNQAGSPTGRTTTVAPFNDGTIGRITIPALNNRVASVRPGVALPTLDHYIGHFSNTSQWDGNIALASHNRGPGSFFAGIWTLQYGDRIIYETTLGVRIYEVEVLRKSLKMIWLILTTLTITHSHSSPVFMGSRASAGLLGQERSHSHYSRVLALLCHSHYTQIA